MQARPHDGSYSEDFIDWILELRACLPMIASWLDKCDESVRLKWQELLEPVDLAFAKNQLNRMLHHSDKAVTESTHWQTIPATIRTAWFRDSYKNPDLELPPRQPIANNDPLFDFYFSQIRAIRKEYDEIPGIWQNVELKAQWKSRVDAVVQEYCDALDNSRRGTLKRLVHAELVID